MGLNQRCTTDKYLEGVNDYEAGLVIYILPKCETSGKLTHVGKQRRREGGERKLFGLRIEEVTFKIAS